MTQATLPFDTVRLGTRHLNAQQFMALPLGERLEHIFDKRIAFTNEGAPVDTRTALAALRNCWRFGGTPAAS